MKIKNLKTLPKSTLLNDLTRVLYTIVSGNTLASIFWKEMGDWLEIERVMLVQSFQTHYREHPTPYSS